MIEQAGLRIIAQKRVRITPAQAETFYAVHRERPFYASLVKFMTEGPVWVMALERENAVEHLRNIMGATNPANAAPGTIRAVFAESIERNAIHGSDSPENAAIELGFFFPAAELV
jgi:nucleoside-diphosphate kinase